MYFCDPWFDYDSSNADKHYGTIIHEVTHHFGTTDEIFDGGEASQRRSAKKLSDLTQTWGSTEKALNNAENYNQFVQDVAAKLGVRTFNSADAPTRHCEFNGDEYLAETMCGRYKSNYYVTQKRGTTPCNFDLNMKKNTVAANVNPFTPACHDLCLLVERVLMTHGTSVADVESYDCANMDAEAAALGPQPWHKFGNVSHAMPQNTMVYLTDAELDAKLDAMAAERMAPKEPEELPESDEPCLFNGKPYTESSLCLRHFPLEAPFETCSKLNMKLLAKDSFTGDCRKLCEATKESCPP